MPAQIFISYSKADRSTAEAICAKLEALDFRCWMAPRNIVAGREWAESIVEAIDGCDAFVLVFSPAANASKHVLREVERAAGHGKIVIRFRVADIPTSNSLAYYLDVAQWFDGFPPPVEKHLDRFVRTLQAALAAKSGAQPESPATPPAPPVPSAWRRWGRWVALAGGAVVMALAALWGLRTRGGRLIAPLDPEEQKRLAEIALSRFTPTAPPRAGLAWTNSIGMKFLPVPGADVLFCAWETREQDFEAFVKGSAYDATGHVFSMGIDGWKERGDTWKNPGFDQGPTYPVCGVNFDDAMEFCAWLTEKERTQGYLLPTQSYRLPTDAEWSLAVGLPPEPGRTPAEKNQKAPGVYPWGTQWPPPPLAGNYAGSEAWDDGNAPQDVFIAGYRDDYRRTAPVGSFRPNPYGLYDLGGNVWEWTMDDLDPAAEAPLKVLRGAAWQVGHQVQLLSSYRHAAPKTSRYTGGGFRCVLVLGAPASPAPAHAP